MADLNLPVQASEFTWPELRAPLAVDKKTIGGMPKFVLISEIGISSFGNEIPEELMESIWNGI